MVSDDIQYSGFYLLGQVVAFSQAFPTLARLKARVSIRPAGPDDPNPHVRDFTLSHPPDEHIRCPRPGCTEGGWRLGDVLRAMVAQGETERRMVLLCPGRDPTSPPQAHHCATQFSALIELAYKTPPP